LDQVGCEVRFLPADPSGVWCVQLQGGGRSRRGGGTSRPKAGERRRPTTTRLGAPSGGARARPRDAGLIQTTGLRPAGRPPGNGSSSPVRMRGDDLHGRAQRLGQVAAGGCRAAPGRRRRARPCCSFFQWSLGGRRCVSAEDSAVESVFSPHRVVASRESAVTPNGVRSTGGLQEMAKFISRPIVLHQGIRPGSSAMPWKRSLAAFIQPLKDTVRTS
jgi:hypothetical protein